MKVAVINGSPRGSKGYTSQILEPLIEGMRNAKAEVTLLYASKLKIKPCIGEFHCWYKKPVECILKDDMQAVYELLTDSDILILATPMYIPLPGDMQNLINRLCPLFEPILENRNGRTRAKFHDHVRIKKIILVATGGWWELGNLDILKRIVEELAANANVEFGGAILRPHAFIMDSYPDNKKIIISALRESGYQLIKEGKISPDKLKLISKPLISFEDYLKKETNHYLRVKKSQKAQQIDSNFT
jgi:multimeric flavodoxin WrbA